MYVLSHAELKCIPFLMQEALIAEVVIPIWKSGTFARLDGFRFLRMVARKIAWLRNAGAQLTNDLEN
jgi:hypothetical protein